MSVRRHARTRLPRLRTPRLLLAAVVLAALTVTGVGVAGALWPQPDRATTPTAAASPYAAEPAPVVPDRTVERPDRGTRPYAEAPAASPTPSPQQPSPREPDSPESSSPESDSPQPVPDGGGVVTSGTCEASYYWEPQPTASGEVFDPEAMTAAHKTWAFGTRVRVTNPANGQSVVVRINDRGPYIDGRCLDLARGAFREIASLQQGVAMVNYEVLSD